MIQVRLAMLEQDAALRAQGIETRESLQEAFDLQFKRIQSMICWACLAHGQFR